MQDILGLCKISLYKPVSLRNWKLSSEKSSSHLVRNHLKRVTKPGNYVLLPCLFGQRAQSPRQRGYHPPGPPGSAEASLPESAHGKGSRRGPQVEVGTLSKPGWGREGRSHFSFCVHADLVVTIISLD